MGGEGRHLPATDAGSREAETDGGETKKRRNCCCWRWRFSGVKQRQALGLAVGGAGVLKVASTANRIRTYAVFG